MYRGNRLKLQVGGTILYAFKAFIRINGKKEEFEKAFCLKTKSIYVDVVCVFLNTVS